MIATERQARGGSNSNQQVQVLVKEWKQQHDELEEATTVAIKFRFFCITAPPIQGLLDILTFLNPQNQGEAQLIWIVSENNPLDSELLTHINIRGVYVRG